MKHPFSTTLWERLTTLGRPAEDTDGSASSYTDPQVGQLLRLIATSRRALKSEESYTYDTFVAWQKVRKRILPRRHRLHNFLRYAALVALLLGSVLYFALPEHEPAQSPIANGNQQPTILPGTSKARLILANGEQITLGQNTQTREFKELGLRLTTDSLSAGLQYRASSSPASGQSVSYNILSIPKGGEYTLSLPDGTVVWVNSETTFRFPSRFANGKREVWLDGEAYFSVHPDASAPFHVHTRGQKITVLGTSFNVSAYADAPLVETTLVEGAVRIRSSAGEVTLLPSEQYLFDAQKGTARCHVVDTDLYTSWRDGKYHFKAYTFEEIVKKLERWYDFSMVYASPDIRCMRFSGVINKHRPMEETLRFLEKTSDICFNISGKTVTVSRKQKGRELAVPIL